MKKVIPEVVEWFCDRCKKQMEERQIDCKGEINLVARDLSGARVGGRTKTFDLCGDCSFDIQTFFSGKAVKAINKKKATKAL